MCILLHITDLFNCWSHVCVIMRAFLSFITFDYFINIQLILEKFEKRFIGGRNVMNRTLISQSLWFCI